MQERNIEWELDEILTQNARESFSKCGPANYRVLGVSPDLLSVLPGMMLEDMEHLGLNESKTFIWDLCNSNLFEKIIVGYKILSVMPELVKNLTVEELVAIRSVEEDYLLHIYFTQVMPVFLRENNRKYAMIELLMSSNNETILVKGFDAIKAARSNSDDIVEYAKTIAQHMGKQSKLLPENSNVADVIMSKSKAKPINSEYFVA